MQYINNDFISITREITYAIQFSTIVDEFTDQKFQYLEDPHLTETEKKELLEDSDDVFYFFEIIYTTTDSDEIMDYYDALRINLKSWIYDYCIELYLTKIKPLESDPFTNLETYHRYGNTYLH